MVFGIHGDYIWFWQKLPDQNCLSSHDFGSEYVFFQKQKSTKLGFNADQ